MQATRLCLVRHGETAWNAERRIQGQLDQPLSAVGHAQARAAASWLAPGRARTAAFAAIYSSDLTRARQTAEAAALQLGLPITLRPELRERHYGVFQTLTYNEIRSRYPREYARFEAREIDFACPGGGESLRRFSERVVSCAEEIAARHAGGQALIFTHGGVLDILHRQAGSRPLSAPRDFEIPNAAFNWMEVRGGRWSIVAWADRGHLIEALDEI